MLKKFLYSALIVAILCAFIAVLIWFNLNTVVGLLGSERVVKVAKDKLALRISGLGVGDLNIENDSLFSKKINIDSNDFCFEKLNEIKFCGSVVLQGTVDFSQIYKNEEIVGNLVLKLRSREFVVFTGNEKEKNVEEDNFLKLCNLFCLHLIQSLSTKKALIFCH